MTEGQRHQHAAGEDRTAEDMQDREKENRRREDMDKKSGQGRKEAEKSAKLIKNEVSFFSDQRAGPNHSNVICFNNIQYPVIVQTFQESQTTVFQKG